MPPLRNYSSTGYIVNIDFNNSFEQKIDKDIIELIDKNILPKWIRFTIKLKDKNRNITKKFNYKNDKEKLNNFIKYYGDNRLDSLIGSEVILKPDYDYTEFEEYNVVIPNETLSSKIKANIIKIRTEIAPRSIQPHILSKYLIYNIARLFCTLMILFLITYFITILLHLNSVEETLLISILMPLFSLLVVVFFVLSSILQDKINTYKDTDEQYLIGDIERSLLTYIIDSGSYIKKQIKNIDIYIGKKL